MIYVFMAPSKVLKAIKDFKKGKFVILVDDLKENEADLVLAAEKVTPQKINFMIKNACGLICVPMLGKRLKQLKLPLMTKVNTEFSKCAFTISVDYKKGTTTGISAFDRANTIKALINKNTTPSDLARPGHVFPLMCDKNGIKKRYGHTESVIEMTKLANLYPAAVICEIIGQNGRMAKTPELNKMAKKYNLKIISINDLI